ncbi:cytochrome c oxidase subunit II [Maritalea sp.]|uniref:cytochrome c oxidase subunit II n=1 Tax=Maritalea sp. TaxID=2003361 RepID=UPI003EF6C88E
MSSIFARLAKVTTAIIAWALPATAFAQTAGDPVTGQPTDGAIGFQPSVTTIMDSTAAFHDGLLMPIIVVITLFVTALLIWVMFRYNAKANPTPSRTTHNTFIEIVWTVVPILILIVIAIPSFGVLADQMITPDGERKYLGSSIFSRENGEQVPAAEVTITATGYQWYWGFEYNDLDGASFDSIILSDDEIATLKPGQPKLLAVDNDLVVPVGTTVRMLVTAADVIHAFAVPAFGVKTDAVPGRVNETWFNARKEGMYYGQCSELCGKDHAFMPIAVRVVSKEDYKAWSEKLKAEDDVEAANMILAGLK